MEGVLAMEDLMEVLEGIGEEIPEEIQGSFREHVVEEMKEMGITSFREYMLIIEERKE